MRIETFSYYYISVPGASSRDTTLTNRYIRPVSSSNVQRDSHVKLSETGKPAIAPKQQLKGNKRTKVNKQMRF